MFSCDAKQKIKSSKTAKKVAQNQKPHAYTVTPDTVVTRGAYRPYRVNYTNTNFIKVFYVFM